MFSCKRFLNISCTQYRYMLNMQIASSRDIICRYHDLDIPLLLPVLNMFLILYICWQKIYYPVLLMME